MLRAVVDPHTLIWHLYADQRLSSTAQAVMEETAANGDRQIQLAALETIW